MPKMKRVRGREAGMIERNRRCASASKSGAVVKNRGEEAAAVVAAPPPPFFPPCAFRIDGCRESALRRLA